MQRVRVTVIYFYMWQFFRQRRVLIVRVDIRPAGVCDTTELMQRVRVTVIYFYMWQFFRQRRILIVAVHQSLVCVGVKCAYISVEAFSDAVFCI
jgi:hypothetical protein